MRNIISIAAISLIMVFIFIGTYVISMEIIRVHRIYNVKRVIENNTTNVNTVLVYD